ncbi:hypothetical protein TNCV_3218411 [Trichonephila clavipes]|nr:hypothetical protein TNCV_3218411 [Trichonephila clavipes]
MGFLWFRKIENYHSAEFSAKRGRPSAEHSLSSLSKRHFVDYIPPTEKKTNPVYFFMLKERDSKRKKVRRETRFCCPDCGVGRRAVSRFLIYIIHQGNQTISDLHDNVRPHFSRETKAALKNRWEILEHPPERSRFVTL